MKKQIHPGVAVGIVLVALVLTLIAYYKKTEPPPPMPMNPLGPGAALLRKNGGDLTKFMSAEEKQRMAGHPAPPPPPGAQPTPSNNAPSQK